MRKLRQSETQKQLFDSKHRRHIRDPLHQRRHQHGQMRIQLFRRKGGQQAHVFGLPRLQLPDELLPRPQR